MESRNKMGYTAAHSAVRTAQQRAKTTTRVVEFGTRLMPTFKLRVTMA